MYEPIDGEKSRVDTNRTRVVHVNILPVTYDRIKFVFGRNVNKFNTIHIAH